VWIEIPCPRHKGGHSRHNKNGITYIITLNGLNYYMLACANAPVLTNVYITLVLLD
jgi:hypothetical protein